MAKNSTTQAVIRSGPKSSAGSLGHAGSAILGLPVSLNPAAASASTGMVIPEGCIVLGFQHDGGATGGTNPTFDMGTSGDPDGYINEGDADASGFVAVNGALANTATTAPTTIYAGVGSSAATGGTISGYLLYVRVDSTGGLNE